MKNKLKIKNKAKRRSSPRIKNYLELNKYRQHEPNPHKI